MTYNDKENSSFACHTVVMNDGYFSAGYVVVRLLS